MKRTPLRRKTSLKAGKWNPTRIRAKPEWLDGIFFPSKGEAETYRYLKMLEKGGAISGLVVHPKIILIPGDIVRGLPEVHWSPDFGYMEHVRMIYVDAKDRPTTEREEIILKLWQHFMDCPLRLTKMRNGTACIAREIMGKRKPT